MPRFKGRGGTDSTPRFKGRGGTDSTPRFKGRGGFNGMSLSTVPPSRFTRADMMAAESKYKADALQSNIDFAKRYWWLGPAGILGKTVGDAFGWTRGSRQRNAELDKAREAYAQWQLYQQLLNK